MKKMLLGLAFSISFIAAEKKNTKPLQDFQNTIIKAETAPFIFMPCYAYQCNNHFNQRPNVDTRIKWCQKTYKEQNSANNLDSNKIIKKDVIEKASIELAKRNTFGRVIGDTLFFMIVGAAVGFLGQYASSKLTGTPVTWQNINTKGIGVTSGIGTSIGLVCHGSMYSMRKQAEKIIDYNAQD